MAELKTKFIRYPNEREAWGELGIASEQSIKDCIVDIHDFFTNTLGLAQTDDSGQIDFTNISDLNIKSIYDKSTTSRFTSFSYGYAVYEFTDELQSEYPIYIKLQFNMIDGSYNTNASYRSRTYFSVVINVMGQTDGSGNSVSGAMNLGYTLSPMFATSSNNANNFSNTLNDSYGFFDKQEGRLFFCLCPTMYKGSADSVYTAPLGTFYVERSKDSSNVVNEQYVMVQSYSRGTWDSATVNRQFNTYFSTYDAVTYNSSLCSYVPMDGITTNTGMRYNIFRTISVNPRTKEITANSNVLSYYDADIPCSGIEVDVRLSDLETRRYITVSPTTTRTYTYNAKFGHLIRVS